ncbi:MAG: SDR family oxidoreductase, partial [Acidimicrobiales bacterium]
TAGLAKTFAPEVRVNCLMPGPFATDISKAWHPGVFEHFKTAVPLQRAGEPHEIVGAALLLASDAGSYITGSIIRLDGGVSGIAGNG